MDYINEKSDVSQLKEILDGIELNPHDGYTIVTAYKWRKILEIVDKMVNKDKI